MRRFSPHDVRTRLFLVVTASLALGLIAATVGFNVLLVKTSERDANSLLQQRVVSERSLVQVRRGRLLLTEHFDDRLADSRVWIFGRFRVIEAPSSRPETARAASMLNHGPSRFTSLAHSDERLLSLPIVDHGTRYGTIVAGISLAPYEHTIHLAVVGSSAFAATLLLLVGAAVWWLLHVSLRPVAQMTAQAAAWSEGDMEGRFRLGNPHDELTRLGWTLDRLLDRIAASLRHERLLSAELSHELRTPLARLRAEAELALRRPRTTDEYAAALSDVIANADRIEEIINVLLSAAKHQGGQHGVADAGAVARTAAGACEPSATVTGVDIRVQDDEPLRVGVDAAFAERVLHPVLANACRYASSRVTVDVSREDGSVLFTVSDDGPGVRKDESAHIFEPATRGAAGRSSGEGAGLGLALARRLARSVAGDVEAEPCASGGRFVVRLPAV